MTVSIGFGFLQKAYTLAAQVASTFAPAVEYHFTGHVSYELDSPVGESSPIQLKSQ